MEYEKIGWENSENTPVTAQNLKHMDEAIYRLFQAMYPVGALYFTTETHNPSDLFGGEWEMFGIGKAIIGAGELTGETEDDKKLFETEFVYGSYEQTLTFDNLPAHTHNVLTAGNGVAESGTIIQRGYQASTSILRQETTATGSFNPTPISTMQPSIGVNIWKRIA